MGTLPNAKRAAQLAEQNRAVQEAAASQAQATAKKTEEEKAKREAKWLLDKGLQSKIERIVSEAINAGHRPARGSISFDGHLNVAAIDQAMTQIEQALALGHYKLTYNVHQGWQSSRIAGMVEGPTADDPYTLVSVEVEY